MEDLTFTHYLPGDYFSIAANTDRGITWLNNFDVLDEEDFATDEEPHWVNAWVDTQEQFEGLLEKAKAEGLSAVLNIEVPDARLAKSPKLACGRVRSVQPVFEAEGTDALKASIRAVQLFDDFMSQRAEAKGTTHEVRQAAVEKERAMASLKAVTEQVKTQAEQFWPEADFMHSVLIKRADELVGCNEGSPEEAELRSIADALEAYEARRWPSGKVAGGKG